jgi:hypothetical protein
MTVTMRHKYFGTCMDTLRECYDWMKDDAIFDDDYEVVIDLPDLKTTITNDEEWALAMLTIK